MPRLPVFPILMCLAASLASGCQTAQQTARVERPRGDAFWTADGRSSTSMVARKGEGEVRFASRDTSNGGTSFSGILSGGTGKERIPLPRTQPGGLRNVDRQASAEQGIGAF
ncbi:MAG: hypothetical protein M3552_12405 [Planctomycetota bacterium]|nr:hypothetical protein [Planctomycetaceae bacterium]MDQ3331435.1 hypothetical protein [Planctomycetota bacterium]